VDLARSRPGRQGLLSSRANRAYVAGRGIMATIPVLPAGRGSQGPRRSG
jgi:hypothetical protein